MQVLLALLATVSAAIARYEVALVTRYAQERIVEVLSLLAPFGGIGLHAALRMVLLAAATAGFLAWSRPPARIFSKLLRQLRLYAGLLLRKLLEHCGFVLRNGGVTGACLAIVAASEDRESLAGRDEAGRHAYEVSLRSALGLARYQAIVAECLEAEGRIW